MLSKYMVEVHSFQLGIWDVYGVHEQSMSMLLGAKNIVLGKSLGPDGLT